MASHTALCLWETNRIAMGYALLDQLLKDYPISFVKHYRICPGKAFFLLSADTDVVKQIEHFFKDKDYIQYRTITGIHPDVLSVFQQKKMISSVSHLGIYECTTSVAAFHLANYLAWHHHVDLFHLQIGVGLCGKSIIIIAASCKEGHGGEALYEAIKNMESPQQILNDIHGVPRNETKPYQWKIQILARILNHFKVIVVTEDCDHQVICDMHMTPASTLEEALGIARGIMGEDASITIIPNGSTVIVE